MTSARRKSGAALALEYAVIIAIAFGLALLIQRFLVKPFQIPSGSMRPTLAIGQRVLVNRIGERFGTPTIGDIVVFHPPAGANGASRCGDPREGRGSERPCGRPTAEVSSKTPFIKRVVAGPGDRIAIRDGHVVLNGKLQREPFVKIPCTAGGAETCTFPRAITVPPGEWFMMGDNRGDSEDSRFWGPVPSRWIIGEAFATYWPLDRIGLL